MWNSRYFRGKRKKKRNTDCRTSAAGDERVLFANQVLFFHHLVCAMRMTGKKSTRSWIFHTLTFCTHSMLHNFLCACFSLYLFHAWCSRAREKRLDTKTAKHKFLFSCCKECTCFSQRQSVKCTSMMMFFVRVRPGTTFEFVIIPFSTLFFFFPSLSLLKVRTVFMRCKSWILN